MREVLRSMNAASSAWRGREVRPALAFSCEVIDSVDATNAVEMGVSFSSAMMVDEFTMPESVIARP